MASDYDANRSAFSLAIFVPFTNIKLSFNSCVYVFFSLFRIYGCIWYTNWYLILNQYNIFIFSVSRSMRRWIKRTQFWCSSSLYIPWDQLYVSISQGARLSHHVIHWTMSGTGIFHGWDRRKQNIYLSMTISSISPTWRHRSLLLYFVAFEYILLTVALSVRPAVYFNQYRRHDIGTQGADINKIRHYWLSNINQSTITKR